MYDKSLRYCLEVEAEAQQIVTDGEGSPWGAYALAHKRVQQRRREKAAQALLLSDVIDDIGL